MKNEQPKIRRILRLIRLLHNEDGISMNEIAQELKISTRTAHRYLQSFRQENFSIQTFHNKKGETVYRMILVFEKGRLATVKGLKID